MHTRDVMNSINTSKLLLNKAYSMVNDGVKNIGMYVNG